MFFGMGLATALIRFELKGIRLQLTLHNINAPRQQNALSAGST